jgi:anti-sigma regulatory factor (Ser/Thr protein kinase)
MNPGCRQPRIARTSIRRLERLRHDSFSPPAMDNEIRFSFPCDRRLVPPTVCLLQDFGVRIGVLTEAERTRAGVALEEALLNAIIHGNLEVSSKLRDQDDGSFERLIALRASKSPYRNRRVDVSARYSADEVRFAIRDEGPGFDVGAIPDPTKAPFVNRQHGRGLLLMRTFMDEVTYNATGNQVTLVKRKKVAVPGLFTAESRITAE